MKDQKNTSLLLSKCFLSYFGSGYFPKAPGTVGSLLTIPLIIFLSYTGIGFWGLIILTALLTISSCLVAEKVQKRLGLHDPQWIVIDEVIGMLVCWSFIFPSIDWLDLTIVFIIFRFFDIIKIWPASFFDRLEHGAGTILDDVVSGVMAGIVVLILKNYY